MFYGRSHKPESPVWSIECLHILFFYESISLDNEMKHMANRLDMFKELIYCRNRHDALQAVFATPRRALEILLVQTNANEN